MSATLNYEIKKYWKMFRLDDDPGAEKNRGKYARSDVLMYLLLCSNGRLRCWPDIDQIAEDLAINKETACEAVAWLVSRKAVCLVPYDKRIGAEKKLHNRKNVYQMTGIIQFTDMEPVQYLYMRPGERREIIEELNGIEAGETAALLAEFCPDPEPEKTSEKDAVQSPTVGLSQSPTSEVQSPTVGLSQSPTVRSLHYKELKSSTKIYPSSSSSMNYARAEGENFVEKNDEDDDDKTAPEIAEIVEMYVQNMPGTLTPLVADAIKDAIQEFGAVWLRDAIREAVLRNARNWKYIDKILQSWKLEGRDKTSLGRRPFPPRSSAPPPPAPEPEWFDAEGNPDAEGAFQKIEGELRQMRRLKEYRHLLTMTEAESA